MNNSNHHSIIHRTSQIAFLAVFLLCGLTDVQAQQIPESWDNGTTQTRLRAVYERGDFQAKGFPAKWSTDSSTYSIQQRDPDTQKMVPVHFDVRTGEPTEAKPSAPSDAQPQPLVSPDGKWKLEFRGGDLVLRNLETDEQTELLTRKPDRDLSFGNLRWSPDGKHVAFIETDRSEVKQRSILVPEDPSYPGVRQQRFARVGGKISTLRVGIVDVESKKQQWLPIDSPDEGFYLGLVEWAGDTRELLIERLSRFRDQREFFLASTDGTMKRIFHESDPAWVVASQAKNSGLTWTRDGQAFVVISEKDGWRHAYLYSRSGGELSLLTPGEYDIIDRAVVDEAGGWYYFYASPENATEKYLYRVPLDGSGQLERVTPQDQPGTHDYDFSPDAKWAFHTFSNFDTPALQQS